MLGVRVFWKGSLVSDITTTHARVAALTRSRASDDPDLICAKRDLKTARLADHIARAVDAAPPLTIEQRERLVALLRPIPSTKAG